MKLSEHFTISEFTNTSKTQYLAQNKEAVTPYINSLKRLCIEILEPIRDFVGKPIIISSGFRCRELNAAVGGSDTSQHTTGEACDIVIANHDLRALWQHIKTSGLNFGQNIYEVRKNTAWLHISLPSPKLRKNNDSFEQVLK